MSLSDPIWTVDDENILIAPKPNCVIVVVQEPCYGYGGQLRASAILFDDDDSLSMYCEFSVSMN